jgi:hypothetical protein
MQDWDGKGKHESIRVELPEHTSFLDWARRSNGACRPELVDTLDKGICTRSMMIRNRFLRCVHEEIVEDSRCGPGKLEGDARRQRDHVAIASYPYATPTHIVWSRELRNDSRSIQEQVNYSISEAKHLKAAEELIRPRCRVPV